MSAIAPQVTVLPGDGLVARYGANLVVSGPTSPEQRGHLNALLGLVENVSRPVPEPDSASVQSELFWRITRTLANAKPADLGTFGVAVPSGRGYALLLFGQIWAQVSTETETLDLTGTTASTWTDRVIATPLRQLRLSLAKNPLETDGSPSHIQGGIAAGGGICAAFTAAPIQAVRAIREPTVTATRPRVSNVAAVNPTQAPLAPPDTDVTGALRVPPQAVRQALGRLVEMGSDPNPLTLALDRTYVVGRDPTGDPAVRNGSATPIRMNDKSALISRVHLRLSITPNGVMLADLGSVNGTYVAAPGAPTWTRISGDTELPVGWSLRVGERVFRYQATDS